MADIDLIFKVGSFDLTNFIVVGDYDVKKEDIFKEWQDASFKYHKDCVRTQINGEFTVQFVNLSDYQAFMTAMSYTQGQPAYCSVYCTNTCSVEEYVLCDLEYTPVLTQYGTKAGFKSFKIKVEER